MQVRVDQQKNEIVATPEVLRQIDRTGMVVTGDALHPQRAISSQIVEQGGDYLWPVKANQPTLHDNLERLFAPNLVAFAGEPTTLNFRTAHTVEKGHGRIEERTITGSSLLNDHCDWPYLAQVFRINYRHTAGRTGKVSTEIRYGITSQPPEGADPQRLLAQVRGEWAMETGLHGRRDVTLHEDESHVRQGRGPQMIAALNNTVIGLALNHGVTNLAAARRTFHYLVDKCLHRLCLSLST